MPVAPNVSAGSLTIVLDASAAVDLLLNRTGFGWIGAALERDAEVHVPHLIETEVLNALRRWLQLGRIDSERARAALDDLAEMPLTFHPHSPYLNRVWSLRESLTAYDATYVAIAEALGARLLTSDGRLARAAAGLVGVIHSPA